MAKGSGRRITAVAAASWLVATLVTSLVVWRAVAVFTDGESTDVLSAPQVSARLGSATATPRPTSAAPTFTPSPSRSSVETTTRSSSETSESSPASQVSPQTSSAVPTVAATPVVRTWTVAGGSLSVSCQGQVLTLVYARPQDGWRVETEHHGSDRVDVAFERVGQGTDVRAACVNGVPQQTTVATQGDH
ncbi:MAG TPA: hypothetical protein VFK68_02560 [Propionibacteriaceae bacterium]|nr:hypothetical protein [Propionibacteriaceae bacterium]